MHLELANSVNVSGNQELSGAIRSHQTEASERRLLALLVPAVAAGADFGRPSEVDQRRPSRKRWRRVGRRAGAACVEDGAGDVPNGMVVRAVAAAK